MKKNVVLWMSMLGMVMLCACTAKENNEKPIMTPTVAPTEAISTNTPRPTPTPTIVPEEVKQFQEYLASMETMDWTELDCYVDKETSIRNSNLLNYGYITYDEAGNLYYTDQNNGDIYISDYNGENKRLLCQTGKRATRNLLVQGEWLYYTTSGAQGAVIERVHIVTGEMEQIEEEPSRQYWIKGEKLYTIGNKGLCVMDLDGKNKKVIDDTIKYTNTTVYSEECFLSGIYTWWANNRKNNSSEGYLMFYDGDKKMLLNQRGCYPLLAGNYLCISDAGNPRDSRTTKFRIWNLETKEETELGSFVDQRVLSDGETVYYARIKYDENDSLEIQFPTQKTFFYKWTGGEPEQIWTLDTALTDTIFLTPKALYAGLNQAKYHLWYYDLETGETGQVY